MQRLKVFIDPRLKRDFAPEIYWTFRLMLISSGISWEESHSNTTPCDLAYVVNAEGVPSARISIRAQPEAWQRRHEMKLSGLHVQDDFRLPSFAETRTPQIFLFRENALIILSDLIFAIFWTANGLEEWRFRGNRHHHMEIQSGAYLETKFFRQGIVSEIIVWLEKQITSLCEIRGRSRWPSSKMSAVCVSHDVDYPEVIRWLEPARILLRCGWRGSISALKVLIGKMNHWNFEKWMEIEKSFGIRSAFYFVAYKGNLLRYLLGTPDPFYDVEVARFQQLFAKMIADGFEVGLQPSYNAYQNLSSFNSEKQRLAAACRSTILGGRHHYWHLSPHDPEATLILHEQSDLLYDASLAHERYLGWRRGVVWPYFPFSQKERREIRTLQLPTAWMDDQLFKHGLDNVGLREDLLQKVLGRVVAYGGCFMMDIHDYVLDESLFPGRLKSYVYLLEKICQRQDIWIATPAEIALHWQARSKEIIKDSRGLGIFVQDERGIQK